MFDAERLVCGAGNAARRQHWLTKVEAFFVHHRERLAWVHAAMFLGFLALILLPVFLPEPAEDASALTDYVLAAKYVLWGLWFPLVFLSVLGLGRFWCGLLCPMGAASEWANKKGLQRAIPGWLRWEGTPIVSFLIVTILGQTTGVRDHPEAAAEIFGGTMLAAIVVGFVWGRKKRAWCRHACPIGLLLGVFSRLGAVQFAPKGKIAGGDGYAEKGVCPTMIDTPRKEESRHCIECFRCVNPQAKGSLELRLRRPGLEVEEIRRHHANLPEVWFLFLGSGVALGGFLWLVLPVYDTLRQGLGEWALGLGWEWIGESGPAWLMSNHPQRREVFVWLDFLMISGFMAGTMVALTALLSASTAAAAWVSGSLGGSGTFRMRFTELGYQAAPVAMGSLVIGLGGELFAPLKPLLGAPAMGTVKGALLLAALIWSLWLGWKILARQGLSPAQRLMTLPLSGLGCLAVALAWWPAVVGL